MFLLTKLKKCIGVLRRKVLCYYIWPYFFKKASKEPIDEKKAILIAGNFNPLPDNLACIKEELDKKGYHCVVVYPPEGDNFLKKKIHEFKRNIQFQKDFATAKLVFLEDVFLPLYSNQPREGTKVIQLWHACGAFKKWGYSTAELAWGANAKSLKMFPLHNNYTDVTVSSPKCIEFYAEAFNCDESIIKPVGVPRTDVYFDADFVSSARDEILKLHPEIGDRKILLYAPTFRGNSVIESYMDLKLDLDRMQEEFSDEYVLLYKLHPQTAKSFKLSDEEKAKYKDFLFDVSHEVRVDTALCAADMLITDYSSVIFEYGLLLRPMIFFAYDLEEYDEARSFYNKYEDFVPGNIVRDTQGIVDSIKQYAKGADIKKLEKFKDDYMSSCDGHSTQRISELYIK